jgi:hypothetical protein
VTAEIKIDGVGIPRAESCRFGDSEIEIRYQLWDGRLPIKPLSGSILDIVLRSGVIAQTFTGVIERVLSTSLLPEPQIPMQRATTTLSLSTPIRFCAVGVASYRTEHDTEEPFCHS